MRVSVYRNLHKKCWSVVSREGEDYGRVILHTNSLILTGATFKVSKAGRERVIQEQKKNVHAQVWGELNHDSGGLENTEREVSYNPYHADHFFHCDDKSPIDQADVVTFLGSRCYVN